MGFLLRQGSAEKGHARGRGADHPRCGFRGQQFSVITNEDGWIKRGLGCDLTRPAFAIYNPELTYSLPAYQTAAGATDIMAHIMERYFTNGGNMELTDVLAACGLPANVRGETLGLEGFAALSNAIGERL